MGLVIRAGLLPGSAAIGVDIYDLVGLVAADHDHVDVVRAKAGVPVCRIADRLRFTIRPATRARRGTAGPWFWHDVPPSTKCAGNCGSRQVPTGAVRFD